MLAKLTAVIALGIAVGAQAGTLFSFETGLEGWTETVSGTAVLDLSPTGATDGIQALSLTDGAAGQIQADLTPAQWADIVAHPKITLDYTVPSALFDSWGNYSADIEVGLVTQTGTYWTTFGPFEPQVGTTTLTADFTGVLPADPGSISRIAISHDWGMELLPPDGLTSGPSTLYIDNISAVPEPAVLASLGIASLGLMRRRRAK